MSRLWLTWFLAIVFFIVLGLSLDAHAQESQIAVIPQPDGSMLIILPPEVVKECMESGGCRMITGDELNAFVEKTKKECSAI